MMLWTEPQGPHGDFGPIIPIGRSTRNASNPSTTRPEEITISEIRRLVVIGGDYANATCLAIHTYAGHATFKPGLPDREDHAIIYTGDREPSEQSILAEDGTMIVEELRRDSIRVISEREDPNGFLHPASRINYSKIYIVEKDAKVLNIGKVHNDSMGSLT
ncbi:hypothetical protein F5882DRAFT_258885, partial [Hyaloscypha sp. PMI_1271]